MKVKILRTPGTQEFSKELCEKCKEGETIGVSNDVGERLIKRGIAEPEGGVKLHATPPASDIKGGSSSGSK